ncbi:hypothetical protein KIW84_014631 [Lathyrus oleraceus]|uniref:Uncharacterized protein n=1 Tax=Pisum sativum TaxID=3888 RepID=A0A9D5BNY6_PEA|nr:hypothetical protein KIW84_014631 [Pisum sativum]
MKNLVDLIADSGDLNQNGKSNQCFNEKELEIAMIGDIKFNSNAVLKSEKLILRKPSKLIVSKNIMGCQGNFEEEFVFYVENTRTVRFVKQRIARFFNHAGQELVWKGEALDDQRLIKEPIE